MEHYNNEITSEVKTQPKNKKKIVLISVISVAVVLVITLSVLVPVLILKNQNAYLTETAEASDYKYFIFTANEDRNSYSAKVNSNLIVPKELIVPGIYDNHTVTYFSCSSIQDIESIILKEGIADFYIKQCENLTKITLPKSVTSIKRGKSYDWNTDSFYFFSPFLDNPKLEVVNYFSTTEIESEIFEINSTVTFRTFD